AHPAAHVPRHRANDRADGDGDQHREGTDRERHARAVHQTAPHVAAIEVGAEGMEQRGGLVLERHDLERDRRAVRRDPGRGDGQGDEEAEHEEAPRGGPVLEEAPPRGRCGGVAARFAYHEERERRAQVHSPCTRMRGSAMAYSTSASRLPSTTIVLALVAAASTTG